MQNKLLKFRLFKAKVNNGSNMKNSSEEEIKRIEAYEQEIQQIKEKFKNLQRGDFWRVIKNMTFIAFVGFYVIILIKVLIGLWNFL